jgi:hypothetical protein
MYKIKGKIFPIHAMKAYRESENYSSTPSYHRHYMELIAHLQALAALPSQNKTGTQ